MSQDELATTLGVGRSTIQKLERGHAYAKVQPVHRSAARALGWTEDSPEAVLAGGEPTRIEGGVPPAPARVSQSDQSAEVDELLDELSERVKLALLGGKVVDGDVIDLAPDDPDSVAVLILKRGERPDATPEQMRADLKKWARLQRAAREIFSDDTTGQ